MLVGVDAYGTTKGLIVGLFERQVHLVGSRNNVGRERSQHDGDVVAAWQGTQVVDAIAEAVQRKQEHTKEEACAIGGIKYMGLVDATVDAPEAGEVAKLSPYVLLPGSELDSGCDPLVLAAIAAEKQCIMNETA